MRDSKRPFKVMVRIHLHPGITDTVSTLIEDFRKDFGGDPRFFLFIRPVVKLGGARDAKLPVLDFPSGLQMADDLSSKCKGLGIESRTMPQGEESAICYASRANSWVVRADGRLNKCTVALERDFNQVGEIAPDGALLLKRDRLKPWMRGLSSLDIKELSCPLQGGVPIAGEI